MRNYTSKRNKGLELIENFDYIQLHGSESKERVNEIKNMGIKVIKAIKIKDEEDINIYKEYNNADLILFDSNQLSLVIHYYDIRI